MSIITNKNERTRFIKFATVGAFGAIVDFSIFNLLTGVFVIKPVLSSIFSFTAAVISNYIWNRYWTYPESRIKNFGSQLSQFTLVSLVGLAIRAVSFVPLENIILSLTSKFVPVSFFIASQTIGYNITLALLIVIVMFWNFFANRYWTYNDIK
jgi:putative flippase GtrA